MSSTEGNTPSSLPHHLSLSPIIFPPHHLLPKIQIGLTFLVPAYHTQAVLEKRPLNGCLSVGLSRIIMCCWPNGTLTIATLSRICYGSFWKFTTSSLFHNLSTPYPAKSGKQNKKHLNKIVLNGCHFKVPHVNCFTSTLYQTNISINITIKHWM